MSKKKKPTLVDKRTANYVKEFCLKFVESLRHKPHFWKVTNYKSHMDPAFLQKFRDAADLSLTKKDPCDFLKEKLEVDDYDLFHMLRDATISEKQPFYISLKWATFWRMWFHLDLSYSNNRILEAVERELESFKKNRKIAVPVVQHSWTGPRPDKLNGKIVKVIRAPGNCPEDLDSELSELVVRIDWTASKTEIEKALKKVLSQFKPRHTEKDKRFGRKQIETMEFGYQVYHLVEHQGLKFEDVEVKLKRPYKSVQAAYENIWEYLEQKKYGTKLSRQQERIIDVDAIPCFRDGERWVDDCPYKDQPYKQGIPQCEPDCFEGCPSVPGGRDCGGTACGSTRACGSCIRFYQATLCNEANKFVCQDWRNRLGYPEMPAVVDAEVEIGRRQLTDGRQRRALIRADRIGEEESKKQLQGAYKAEYKGTSEPKGTKERKAGFKDKWEYHYREVEESIEWRKRCKPPLPVMPVEYIADCKKRLWQLWDELEETTHFPPYLTFKHLPRHPLSDSTYYRRGKRTISPCWECNGQDCEVGGEVCERLLKWSNRIKPSRAKAYTVDTSKYRNLVSDFSKTIGSRHYELFVASAVDDRALPRLDYFDSGESPLYYETVFVEVSSWKSHIWEQTAWDSLPVVKEGPLYPNPLLLTASGSAPFDKQLACETCLLMPGNQNCINCAPRNLEDSDLLTISHAPLFPHSSEWVECTWLLENILFKNRISEERTVLVIELKPQTRNAYCRSCKEFLTRNPSWNNSLVCRHNTFMQYEKMEQEIKRKEIQEYRLASKTRAKKHLI
jgi:hypothetical protein